MTYRFSLEDKEITVPTLQEVSERFIEARDRLGWTPKNLPKGIPVYDEHGAECAAIGINGRVWRGIEDWRSGLKPLYDPLPPVDLEMFR